MIWGAEGRKPTLPPLLLPPPLPPLTDADRAAARGMTCVGVVCCTSRLCCADLIRLGWWFGCAESAITATATAIEAVVRTARVHARRDGTHRSLSSLGRILQAVSSLLCPMPSSDRDYRDRDRDRR
jgi:hypothetical protein